MLVLAGMSLWVAAPALSTSPYLPPATDFEQPLPEVRSLKGAKRVSTANPRPGEGPVTHRSGVLDAPKRFDLVGLAAERRPVELRARAEDGGWTEWVEVAGGDPLYTGTADEVQLRTRGWRPRGTLHYVNVTGTATPVESALSEVRGALSSAVISVAARLTPDATAAVSKPPFISRREWGANRDQGGCEPRTTPAYGKVKAAAVHHTVTANSYTRSEAKGIVLAICRYHRNANGWNDIGYNALVDRFGRLYAGRAGGLDRAVVGAHTLGYNAETAGISAIGNHSTAGATRATLKGYAHYIAWKFEHHGRPPGGRTTLTSQGGDGNRYRRGTKVSVARVFRHGQVNFTACPGDGLEAQMDRIRRYVKRRMS